MKQFRPLLLAAAVALCLSACGDPAPEPVTEPAQTQSAVEETLPAPEQTQPQTLLEILSTREEGEYVQVSTTYGDFRYPFAFSEVVKIQTASGSLEFCVRLQDTDVKLFTISFGGTGSIPLGMITLDGEELPVSAELNQAPANLDDAGMQVFFAAQEIFNDVAVSFQENENVTPAD